MRWHVVRTRGRRWLQALLTPLALSSQKMHLLSSWALILMLWAHRVFPLPLHPHYSFANVAWRRTVAYSHRQPGARHHPMLIDRRRYATRSWAIITHARWEAEQRTLATTRRPHTRSARTVMDSVGSLELMSTVLSKMLRIYYTHYNVV